MTTTTATSDLRRWRSLVVRAVGVVLSAATGVGLVGGLAVWAAFAIPWELPEPPALSGPSVVLAADGSELTRFTSQVDRTEVELSQISQAVQDAVIAAEDAEFYDHTGVDVSALARAVWVNVRTGAIRQGGSTLTQQYVKNTFTGDDLTLRRKLEEAVLAISVERRMTKPEILEAYLNTVYFGEGASGVEAASVTYFGVAAGELTLAQGATLAQLLPAPSRWNPVVDPDGAVRRRDQLLDRMADLGMVGRGAVAEAKATDLGVVERQRRPERYPYVVQHVRRLLVEAYGEETVLTGSLRVTTTIQPAAMEAVRAAVEEQLPQQEERPGVDAGAMAVDPTTGHVLAWYGGRDFATSQFDLAMQARRRPGSTFKPIAYLAALEQGKEPDTVYRAPASFARGDLCDPGWGPANAGGSSYGSLTMREGLYRSVNTVLAQVGCDVGSEALAATAARLGVRSELQQTPQLAIGGVGSNSTVADLAQVFATFANDGIQCPLRTVTEVLDRDGQRLPPPTETSPDGAPRAPDDELLATGPSDLEEVDGPCTRVAEANHVRHVNDALEVVVAETTGTRAQIGRPQAGKTGTTDEEVDAWFAGHTPELALVVRVGDAVEEPLTDIAGFARVQGGTVPALIWRDAAAVLLDGVPASPFPPPGDEDEVRIRPSSRAPSEPPAPSPSPTTEPSPVPTTEAPSPEPDPSPTTPDPGGGNGGNGGGGGGGNECGLLDLGCDPDG